MRFLVIHPKMSIFGGGERVCLHMVKALAEAGHDVTLLCEPFDMNEMNRILGNGHFLDKVQCLSFSDRHAGYLPSPQPRIPLFKTYQLALSAFVHELKLRGALRNFDIILSTQDVVYAPPVGLPIAQYVYYPQNFFHLSAPQHTRVPLTVSRLYYKPVLALQARKVRYFRWLMAVSRFTAQKIREQWKREAQVVYPPVQQLGDSQQKICKVVYVARFVPEKRHDVFFQIARSLPDYHFVAIGGLASEFRGFLRNLVHSKPTNVELLVNAPVERVRHELADSLVYLHCMENEHFGISIVEAMSAGCVPIIHKSGGALEAVGECGFAWETLDEAVKMIQLVFRDDRLATQKRASAVARSQQFGANKFEEQVKNLAERWEKEL